MAATSTDDECSALKAAIFFLNKEFGSDIKDLSKARELYAQISATKKSLEQQLTYASTEAPSKINEAVKDGEDTTTHISSIEKENQKLSEDIRLHMDDVSSLVDKLSALTRQIRELERYSIYLQFIARVEDLSSDIQSALIINSIERSVSQFSEMADLAKSIQDSKCTHLVSFANDTVVFWYKILKEKFSSEFDEVLQAWRWPFIVSTTKASNIQNVSEVKAKLDNLFNFLLMLQLPDGLSSEGQPASPLVANFPGMKPLLLPLQLMIKPLRKRFRFHFYGSKQTNSLDKPEWYFTQTLTWIKDHKEFLKSRIQPLLDGAGVGHNDAVVEFTRGLVVLVMEKLLTDIPELLYDDNLFAHTVDEALAFDKELRSGYGYPVSQPGVLHVLTQDEPFDKWILIERKFALERMDVMLSSVTAWESQYQKLSVDIDDMKVPECGESFMTLMLTITERYKPLPHPIHRLRFLDLQLELLDDFRIRMLQMKNEEKINPLGQRYCAILNTINYILDVLKDWSEVVFFVQLQYYKAQYRNMQQSTEEIFEECSSEAAHVKEPSPMTTLTRAVQRATTLTSPIRETPESLISSGLPEEKNLDNLNGSVFDEMIDFFAHMRKDMLITNIASYVVDDVKARTREYRKMNWLALPQQKESLALSNAACEMLLVLKERLYEVHELLSSPLFETCWQEVASNLNKFIYSELILANRFSAGGAEQLEFDMLRNLFPLFGQYTRRPENYFKEVKEACTLLTLNTGSCMLLKEVLYTALHQPDTPAHERVTDPIAALNDIKVYKLDPNEAELILSLRVNLNS